MSDMRLIDADAYIKYINLALNDAITEGTTIGIIQCMAIAKSIEDDLKNEKITPTIEPERKKGEWKRHPTNREYDVCTSCGTGTKRREYGKNADGTEWQEELNFAFCPWCGADMREEQDDN